MTTLPAHCDKCGGSLIREGDEIKCLNCGNAQETAHERYKFYLVNKGDILRDLEKLGSQKTRAKWGIPVGSWGKIKRRLTDPEAAAPHIIAAVRPVNGLPKLPEFSDSWGEEIQKTWLQIWLCLTLEQNKTEVKHES